MMSVESRRSKIEAMLEQEPEDVFLRYSLAMEMNKDGETEAALGIFAELCKIEPPHVPAYFRRGQILADNERIAEAREVLRAGIEIARTQNDLRAAGEMSELLADLGAS